MKNALISLVLTITLAPLASAQSKAFVYYVPAVARSGGVNGSFFVSDVRAFNKGTAMANVDAYLLSAGDKKSFTIAQNRAASYADVVTSLFGLPGGVGAMRIESDQPLLVSSHLQNVNSLCPSLGGTTGQYLPGVPQSAASTHQRLPHLTSDDGHRANLGVVNTSNAEANLTIKLLDTDSGSYISEAILHVQPQGWIQINQIVDQFFVFEPVPHGMLEVTSDVPVIAYLSLLDNTTNDAFTILGDSAEH
ncbi:MAG TPA: hypothetical protein VGQ76_06505 [Thermoanaerobaculia bacterium]|jgi:hypothetical protein|nr:hypothetical protein [Thermoanaerobaculia bacterium]